MTGTFERTLCYWNDSTTITQPWEIFLTCHWCVQARITIHISMIRRAMAQGSRRGYRVLALESSCDDSCVALLDKQPGQTPTVVDHQKVTLNSAKDGGIIPTAAHEFHQLHFAVLVNNFCKQHNITPLNPPDLVCCTRGPGMVGLLSAGLQMAKGLAIAWNKPLIGVHHMLGHLLVSRLESNAPRYPFLSLLCSGGHTMLVHSRSITEHEVVVNTNDLAAGDSLDKCARELGLVGNMLGKEMEAYVGTIPDELKEEFAKVNTTTRDNEFLFQLKKPLRTAKVGKYPETVEFSFTPFLSSIKQLKQRGPLGPLGLRTNQFVAYKVQEVMFDHLVDRINIALRKHGHRYEFADGKFAGVKDFVLSGGVAANKRLRQKLADLEANNVGVDSFKLHFPLLEWCTDNAVMIGVAGIEIYETLGVRSSLDILPIRKWPMNELLEVSGWVKSNDM